VVSQRHRSMSRRRLKEHERSNAEQAAKIQEHASLLERGASELEEARAQLRDLAHAVQAQSSTMASRMSELDEAVGQKLADHEQRAAELALGARWLEELHARIGGVEQQAYELVDQQPQAEAAGPRELDVGALQRVCASLYSVHAAVGMAAASEAADEKSLALLADLARRFPLSAGASAPGTEACGVICRHIWSQDEGPVAMSRLKLSGGRWRELVD